MSKAANAVSISIVVLAAALGAGCGAAHSQFAEGSLSRSDSARVVRLSFTARADAFVRADAPRKNFGRLRVLRVDAKPQARSYVRFQVGGLRGSVHRAVLRLWSPGRSQMGFRVRAVRPGRWAERSISFRSSPRPMRLGGVSGPLRRGWSNVDVTRLVRGNGAVTLALTTPTRKAVTLASREWARRAPTLLVTTSSTTPMPPPPPPSESPPPPPLPPPPPPDSRDPAPNCIGEPGDHPQVVYPEQRVFLEAQGWWDDRDDDGQVARFGDSEHLHVGLCFPLQQTVSGTIRLDIRILGHNLPAGSVIRNTRFHDASGQLFEDIRYERTVQAGEVDAVVWRTVNWSSSKAPDGLREIRFLTFVDRPDTAEIHASTGWCVRFENGKSDSNHESCSRRLTEGRGWYDCMEYKSSRTDEWTYPYGGVPAGQPYTIRMSGQDGAPFGGGGDDEVTRHWLRFNPNFHTSDVGTLVMEHPGPHRNESVTIPGHLLTPGTHVLFLMTERDGMCLRVSSDTVFPNQKLPQDGIISGGIRIPIKVNASVTSPAQAEASPVDHGAHHHAP